MQSRRLSIALLAVIAVLGLPTKTLPAATTDFTIEVDPNTPSTAVWMTYLLTRLAYVKEHRSEYPATEKGLVVSTFPEELSGRNSAVQIYQAMLAKGTNPRDAYWEDVVKVFRAGFLPEYVWAYFRKPSWNGAAAPKKLGEFAAWRKANLPAHKPLTYGGISYGGTR